MDGQVSLKFGIKNTGPARNPILFYEINICADALYLTTAKIAEVMLHEMAHIYSLQYDIKDTSRGGCYNNKKFNIIAERHGLNCSKTSTGFNDTSLNAAAEDFVKQMNYRQLNFTRERHYNKHYSYIRYVCP